MLVWRQHGVVERMETGSKRSIDQEQIHLYSLGVDVTLSKVRKICLPVLWVELDLIQGLTNMVGLDTSLGEGESGHSPS